MFPVQFRVFLRIVCEELVGNLPVLQLEKVDSKANVGWNKREEFNS
jgi:hypothetical protein